MNIETKIQTGEYEVVSSGQFIAIAAGETRIELAKDSSKLSLLIIFDKDESDKPHIIAENVSDTELRLKLVNFESSLGIGNPTPLKIGIFDDKELFFSYRVFSLNIKDLRTMEYTFYVKQ